MSDWIGSGDVVASVDIPTHLIVGFPGAFVGIPLFVFFDMFAFDPWSTAADSICVLGNVIYNSLITHSFKYCASTDCRPSSLALTSVLLESNMERDLRIFRLLDCGGDEDSLEFFFEVSVGSKSTNEEDCLFM